MGVNYNPRIVTDGLVLALDAGNTKSYRGSGTTWTDLSGNRNNGTLTNGPTYNSANGGTIAFDAVDDYVNLSPSSSFDFSTGPFSIECWFNITANSAVSGAGSRVGNLFMCGHPSNPNIESITWYILGDANTTGTGFGIYKNNNETIAYDRFGTISQNAWHHAVLSRTVNGSNGTMRIYLDASQFGSDITDNYGVGPTSWGLSTGNARIATMLLSGAYAYNFNGRIPIVRVYKGKGLTAAEVRQNFNATRGRYGV